MSVSILLKDNITYTGRILPFIMLSVGFMNSSVANDDTPDSRASTHIVEGQCYIQHQTLFLDLQTNIFMGEDPVAALKSGLTLHFLYEFTIEEADKWFTNDIKLQREFRLRYNPVVQTFVYEDPITLKQVNHNSLEESLAAIGSLEALPLLDVQQLPISAQANGIEIKARFLLNEDLLPVSLRFSALIDKDWHLKSEWWTCRLDV